MYSHKINKILFIRCLQFVRYNNTDSNYNYIKCGIPQGSVLGRYICIQYNISF